MAILEYKLQADDAGMKTPAWVEDGGYFHNPSDNTMIGWSRDNAEWYTPDTVVTLTHAELESRQLAIHSDTPMLQMNDDGAESEMTVEEVKAAVTLWVSTRSS
jgi:hypothetical protein